MLRDFRIYATLDREDPEREDLLDTAARLWPGDATLRTRWLDAVALVRSTDRGWLLDKPVRRRFPATSGHHDACALFR